MNAETGFSQEGFDAVSRALERLYSGQEGIFYRTVIPYALGGKDPLDGIEVWKSEHGWSGSGECAQSAAPAFR